MVFKKTKVLMSGRGKAFQQADIRVNRISILISGTVAFESAGQTTVHTGSQTTPQVK